MLTRFVVIPLQSSEDASNEIRRDYICRLASPHPSADSGIVSAWTQRCSAHKPEKAAKLLTSLTYLPSTL